ncbi:MAG: hypothetical protein JRM82_00945 [Nitrososphaerota archaeon]|nr:hypothetical protein [Nitrososphaerota archaeon]
MRENVLVTVLPFVSVNTTCTVYGLPESEVGAQLNEALEPLHPDGRPDHANEAYVPDPPEAPADRVVVPPVYTGLGVAEGAASSAGSTARERVAVAVSPFPSVTVRLTVRGEPVVAAGVQSTEGVSELPQPDGRLVHA